MRLPEWALILAASEAWGLPPWVIEQEAPALWLDRLEALLAAKEGREISRVVAMLGGRQRKGL